MVFLQLRLLACFFRQEQCDDAERGRKVPSDAGWQAHDIGLNAYSTKLINNRTNTAQK
jgi:hypothetical protein